MNFTYANEKKGLLLVIPKAPSAARLECASRKVKFVDHLVNHLVSGSDRDQGDAAVFLLTHLAKKKLGEFLSAVLNEGCAGLRTFTFFSFSSTCFWQMT